MNIESTFVRILMSKLEGYFSIDLNEKDFFLQVLSTNIYDRMTMKLDRIDKNLNQCRVQIKFYNRDRMKA